MGAEIARAKTILSVLNALDSKAINFGRLYGDSRNLSHEAGRHWLRYIWHVTDLSDSTRLKLEARITYRVTRNSWLPLRAYSVKPSK